jgi:hypothetical protein
LSERTSQVREGESALGGESRRGWLIAVYAWVSGGGEKREEMEMSKTS